MRMSIYVHMPYVWPIAASALSIGHTYRAYM